MLQYFPDPNCTTPGSRDWQQNLCYTEHFNKDVFWNWVGKVDHNFSSNDRMFFRWGKNERNEVRNTTAIRTGPAQNGQLPLIRANDAFVGDWVHIFGGGTVFNVRGGYTYYLEGSQLRRRLRLRRDPVRLAREPGLAVARPRRSAACSRVVNIDQFVQLSRGFGAEHEQELSIQPNISLTRGKHNIRGGLDLRCTNVYNDNYGNAGGRSTSPAHFTRSTLNSTSDARRQRLRVVPARRAIQRQRAGQPRSRTTNGCSRRPGSRTTGASATS